MSSNKNMTWKNMCQGQLFRWDIGQLSYHPNITFDIINKNLYHGWDSVTISMNPNITWEIVQANPHIPWVYGVLLCNPNVTWEIIQANPQINWNENMSSIPYGCFYNNPNLTWEMFEKECIVDSKYAMANELPMEKEKFITGRMQLHRYMSTHVFPELINTMLHPNNFSKLYEWGHFENQY